MDVLGDLIARSRRSDDTALVASGSGREYDYRRFCTSAWKAGNFLSHLGVRSGTRVGVAADPVPESVLTAYGAAMLGATVEFAPPVDSDARAIVVPTAEADRYEAPPGTTLVVYGADPGSPEMAYFERDVWSENPTEPPDIVTPEETLLSTADASYTHAAVLAAARDVVDSLDLTDEDRVAVRAPLTEPGTVAAGLVAPILAGGAIVFPDESTAVTAAVASNPASAPEARVVEPAAVL